MTSGCPIWTNLSLSTDDEEIKCPSLLNDLEGENARARVSQLHDDVKTKKKKKKTSCEVKRGVDHNPDNNPRKVST